MLQKEVYTRLIPLIDSSQNFLISFAERTVSVTGRCKLVCFVSLFTVPPTPPEGDLPWIVAKKFQTQSTKKSFLW